MTSGAPKRLICIWCGLADSNAPKRNGDAFKATVIAGDRAYAGYESLSLNQFALTGELENL
jgi:hypothetical protein